MFNLDGTEFTADAGSRTGSGFHIWSRPANLAWIVGQEVRVSANLAPAPESATVDGTTLVLTHSEDLDTGSVPAAGAYTVKVDGDAGTNPSTVSVGTRTVTLTLATAVTSTSTVTLSYTAPASNPLQDVSGRNAPAFADFAVTNNTDALVSNTHLTPGGPTDKYEAQSFETGGNTGGYTISAVHIRVDFVFANSNTSVKIRENNDSNQPGELVATLANPTSLTTESLNTFLAQDTITLDPRTTYWISVNEGISTSNTAVFGITAGNEETGEPGWSIGDGRLWRDRETHSWSTDSKSLLMTIKGNPRPASTDATLSALTLEGTDAGETIALSPALAPDKYTAAVVNRIDAVKLTATKNDDNATVVITNDDDLRRHARGGSTGPQRRVQHTNGYGYGAGRHRHANLHDHRGTAYRRHLDQQHASECDKRKQLDSSSELRNWRQLGWLHGLRG